MGLPKITGFMIALLVVGFVVATITGLFTALDTGYSVSSNTSLANYQILDKTYNDTLSLKDKSLNVSSTGNFLDVVGDMFRSGWGVIKSSVSSLNTVGELVESASEEPSIGSTAVQLKNLLLGVITILLIIGVFIATLVSRDRL